MEIDTTTVTALVALISVITGAVLQYEFGITAESSKQYQNLKSQAYIDFIRSAAGIAIAQKKNNTHEESDYLALMTDAKIRITVYGSKEVIARMADFFRKYGSLDSPEAYGSFIAIVRQMRSEAVDKRGLEVADSDIGQMLFNL